MTVARRVVCECLRRVWAAVRTVWLWLGGAFPLDDETETEEEWCDRVP